MACGIVTLFALSVIAVVMLVVSRSTMHSQTADLPVTVNGNLTCLPYKNTSPNQPQTEECAIGLKTDDGRYYELQNLPQGASMTPPTKHITVSGDLSPPVADDKYDTRGAIKVKTFVTN